MPEQRYTVIKLAIFFLLSVLCFTKSQGQSSGERVSLFNGKLSLNIPANLRRDTTVVNGVFQVLRATPCYSFSDEVQDVRCIAFQDTSALSDNDVPAFADTLIKRIKNLYASVKITDDGISLNDGKNIGYIKSTVKENGSKKFLQFFYGSLDGRLVLLLVECRAKDRKSWLDPVDLMIKSLRIDDDR